jgi:methionine-rich copper-binding protein CopC
MRLDLAMRVALLLATVVLSPINIDRGSTSRSRVDRIEPQTAKPGAWVMAFGVKLERSRVLDLILSNSERTALTHIVEQSHESVRFQIPQSLSPGQYRVILVVANRWGQETLEQPVSLVVLQE